VFGAVLAIDEHADAAALQALARDFSPRIEACGDREVLVDLDGLERLIGEPSTIAAELYRTAADRGLKIGIAIARTRTAARLLVHGSPEGLPHEKGHRVGQPFRAAVIAIERDDVRRALRDLPIHLLLVVAADADVLTLRRWGLRTLGDVAGLPADAVAARLGQRGVAWQRCARGEDPGPLIPAVPDERFEQSLDLEWPIDSLEPLSFVLGRLMEPLSVHLERRDRAAAVLHVRLYLVKSPDGTREVHARSLELPAPIRDARTLRTLALLDLESHPPRGPVDRVVVAVDPTPGRVVQYSLLARPLPSPEQLSTLMARLTALMGEGRCGSLQGVDSWKPGAFAMKPFAPRDVATGNREGLPHAVANVGQPLRAADSLPPTALRRFRVPLPVRMRLEDGKPVRITTDRRGVAGGRITTCAGPWRTSGAWWDSHLWNRDEWDITLAEGETYRAFQDRESGNWFLEGVID
jgi:protein ImuB